jgi:hypothetical protein
MKNITDVPFPFGSGREKDQFSTLQQEDTVTPVSLYNFEKRFRKSIGSFSHLPLLPLSLPSRAILKGRSSFLFSRREGENLTGM